MALIMSIREKEKALRQRAEERFLKREPIRAENRNRIREKGLLGADYSALPSAIMLRVPHGARLFSSFPPWQHTLRFDHRVPCLRLR
jgi:hypothetical protein